MDEITIWEQNPDQVASILEKIRKNCLKNRHEKTPAHKIKKRKGKKDRDGKQLYWDYVTWGTVTEELDKKYPGWSFEIVRDSVRFEHGHVSIAGKLTVYEPQGLKRVVEAYGCEELIISNDKVVDLMYLKGAETDALKRCAARLGLFNDVYNAIEIEEVEVIEEDIVYFVKNVLPKVIETFGETNPVVIFRLMIKFHQGEWDIPYIEKTLEEINARTKK